jgi:RNA polymerase sigma factor (sigma-70 family)
VATATAGDEDTPSARTDALYREHHALVDTICRLLLRDCGEAEDAAQQVFLSAHRALLNGVVPREPAAWLATIARNECGSRRHVRALVAIDAHSELADTLTTDPSASAMQRAELEALWDEIARLPQAQRDALLLREICGLSYRQLAVELDVTRASARSLLSRAREHVRQRLREASAGLSTAPWLAQLARLIEGGPSPAAPVPAAGKLVVVAVGAAALVVGGTSDAHVRQATAKRPIKPAVATRQAPVVHAAPSLVHHEEPRPTPITSRRAVPVVDRRHRDGGEEHSGAGSTSGLGPGDRSITISSDGGPGPSSNDGPSRTTVSSGESGGSGSSDGSGTSGGSGSGDVVDGSRDSTVSGTSGEGSGSSGSSDSGHGGG